MSALSVAGPTAADSERSLVGYACPPAGAPNVVMIVLDDVGFAQLGCFGSAIATPNIDALAARGVRYNRFHVTAVCSPTRACLLSGRNHHAVGMGLIAEMPLAYPGYNARIPKSAALLPRILRDSGYNTFAVGKWHLAPGGELSAAGPLDRWPLGQGFDRFYGFLSAETSQWVPHLVRDNTFVDPPRTPADGYHLTEDLVDQAIGMVLDQQQATPGKPFFCYLAPGAAHSPHQVPADWVEPYHGRFDDGWEAFRRQAFARQTAEGVVPSETRLTERPPWAPAWDELPADERRLYARYMEVFAGFLTHTDAQIGRFLDFLSERGVLDDTLVLVMSDNGASAEGGPTGTLASSRVSLTGTAEKPGEAIARIDEIGGHRADNHYPWGWAWAGNTPMRLWKRYSWLGGVRAPLVVNWPGRVAEPGSVRSQFCHAVDVFATVLDAAGIEAPAVVDGLPQQPIDGVSLVPSVLDPVAPSPRRTQYFETFGSRAIYHDGWKATTDRVLPMFNERNHIPGSHDLSHDRWSLFHLDEDFSEFEDLSAEYPEKLAALRDLWWSEAGRNQVLPLYEGLASMAALHPAEYPPPRRAEYRRGGSAVHSSRLPPLAAGFDLAADLELPAGTQPEGVICVQGGPTDGWAVYLVRGHATACFSLFGQRHVLRAPEPLAEGRHTVGVCYRPGGELGLLVDGDRVADDRIPDVSMLAARALFGGRLLVGRDDGLGVGGDYEPPFSFTGTLRGVVVESEAPPVGASPADELEVGLRRD